MRVAHVNGRFGPGGGIVTIIRETSRRLQGQGFQMDVFTGPAEGTGGEAPGEPVPVHRFAAGPTQRLHFPLFEGLTEALSRSGADVIHAHNHRMPYVLQAARAARRAKVPLVVSTYYHPSHAREPAPKKAAIRLLDFGFGLGAYGRAAAIVTLSEFEAGRVRPFVLGAPVHVVPPGIDLAPWNPPEVGAPPLDLPREFYLYSGRISEDKGLAYLVRALALLPPAARRPLLLMGPEFGFRRTLEGLAAELGVASLVRFLGFVDAPTYREVLRRAKALVLPSEWESFGIVLLEAMAAGTPVVASRVGAIPEVLEEGQAGLLVPFADPERLAVAMAAVDNDAAATRRRVARGRDRVARYDWSEATARLRAVYEGVTRA